MKKLALACLFAFSMTGLSSAMLSFADGRYLGTGDWRDDAGNTGTYVSYIEFSSDNTRADYAWSNGTAEIMLSFAFDQFGNFEVSENGNVVGSGYCMSIQCSYSIVLNGNPLTEVFSFLNNQLYKLGTGLNAAGTTIYWEEDLLALPITK